MANKVVYSFFAQDKFSRVSENVSRSVNKIHKGVDRLNAKTREAESITRRAASSISSGFKRMAAAAAGFFGAKAFLQQGMEFQDALADLSAITGASGKDLKFLSDESMRLAKKSKIAQAEVAAAFKGVASAKSELLKDPKALSQVTEQVLLLKNTGIDTATATKVLTESLNQFGEGSDQAARFVNVLAAGSKVGAAEVRDIGEAMVNVGFAAKTSGMSFEQTNAALQVMAKNGLKGANAGTILRSILTKLEISGNRRFTPSIVGMDQALKNIAASNLSAAQTAKLVGGEYSSYFNMLTANRGLISQWTKEVTGTNVAQQQAGIRLRTFSARLRGLGITISGAVIKTFLRLEPALQRVTEEFGKWLDSISEEDVNNFVSLLESIGGAFMTVVKAGMAAASVIKGAGTYLGESLAALSTATFDPDLFTSPEEAFSINNKLLGIYEQGPARAPSAPVNGRTDVNVNLKAPAGAVESVKKETQKPTPGMNVGVNMVPES